jgi:hypothetical protein
MAGSRYFGTLALPAQIPAEIFGQRYDADGNTVGGQFQVNADNDFVAADLRYPSIDAATGPWSQPGPTSALGKIEQKIITDFDGGEAAKNVVGGAGNDSFLGSNQADTLNGVGGASAATTC